MAHIPRTLAMLLAGLGLSATGLAWEALPTQAPIPADNLQSAAKIELGKRLFFDPRFSSTGTISCNSCHNVMLGGDDGRPTSMGVHGRTGPRNAPTVWNSAFHATQFWDGRAASLEEQAKGPVVASVEMGMADLDAAARSMSAIAGYRELFVHAFGGDNPATIDNAAKAVAAFERTLITTDSPYDRWARGDANAMTPIQVRGLILFDQLGCTGCHQPPFFGGPNKRGGHFAVFPFHDGEFVDTYRLRDDMGRFAVTGRESDRHKYKVPTLRNVALTAPYFHNGAVPTLDKAVWIMAAVQLNVSLPEEQVVHIRSFLEALTGEFPQIVMPRLPPTPGVSMPTE